MKLQLKDFISGGYAGQHYRVFNQNDKIMFESYNSIHIMNNFDYFLNNRNLSLVCIDAATQEFVDKYGECEVDFFESDTYIPYNRTTDKHGLPQVERLGESRICYNIFIETDD